MRIISLAPSITETLIFLGLGEDIVGVTEQCCDRLAVSDKAIIGSFVQPDVERIVSTRPDLVVTAGRIHERFLNEFARRGVPVFVFGSRSVSDILDAMERLGRICGRAVEPQVNSLRERIDEVRGRLPDDAVRPRVLRLMGSNPLFTPAPGVYQYDALQIAGGKPMPLDTEESYASLSLEAVTSFDPQIIITCGRKRGEEPKPRCKGCTRPDPACQRIIEDMYSWEGWQNVSAVKEGRVYALPCETICHPGPKVAELVEQLAQIVYPDQNKARNMNSGN